MPVERPEPSLPSTAVRTVLSGFCTSQGSSVIAKQPGTLSPFQILPGSSVWPPLEALYQAVISLLFQVSTSPAVSEIARAEFSLWAGVPLKTWSLVLSTRS